MPFAGLDRFAGLDHEVKHHTPSQKFTAKLGEYTLNYALPLDNVTLHDAAWHVGGSSILSACASMLSSVKLLLYSITHH